MKEAKPKFYRKMGTDILYAHTKYIEVMPNMIPYYGPVPIPKETEEPTPEQVEEETKTEAKKENPDLELVIGAIGALDKTAGFTNEGKPKIPMLEKMLSMKIPAELRDKAWAEVGKRGTMPKKTLEQIAAEEKAAQGK